MSGAHVMTEHVSGKRAMIPPLSVHTARGAARGGARGAPARWAPARGLVLCLAALLACFLPLAAGQACTTSGGTLIVAPATSCTLAANTYTLTSVVVNGTVTVTGFVHIISPSVLIAATGWVKGDGGGYAASTGPSGATVGGSRSGGAYGGVGGFGGSLPYGLYTAAGAMGMGGTTATGYGAGGAGGACRARAWFSGSRSFVFRRARAREFFSHSRFLCVREFVCVYVCVCVCARACV